jgi:dihydrodipicolinate synthase/N-acetylneuraminate lyase
MRFRRDPATIRSHGISLGGSTGEPSAQSTSERAAAIRAMAGEFPDLPMIAYNVPSRTAIDIAPAKALAETGRGVLEAR